MKKVTVGLYYQAHHYRRIQNKDNLWLQAKQGLTVAGYTVPLQLQWKCVKCWSLTLFLGCLKHWWIQCQWQGLWLALTNIQQKWADKLSHHFKKNRDLRFWCQEFTKLITYEKHTKNYYTFLQFKVVKQTNLYINLIWVKCVHIITLNLKKCSLWKCNKSVPKLNWKSKISY